MPSSRRSSQSRDQIQVFCTVGRFFFFFFFTIWATREAWFIHKQGKSLCLLEVKRTGLLGDPDYTELVFMLPQCSFLFGCSNKVLWVGWLIASGKSLLSQIWRLCGAIRSKPVFHLLVAARNPQHSLACGYTIPFSASNHHVVSSLRICLQTSFL